MVTQLVSPDTLRWIDDLRAKYGVPGMGITVIRKDGSSGAADHAWKTQTATFGKRNAAGDPFDDKASVRDDRAGTAHHADHLWHCVQLEDVRRAECLAAHRPEGDRPTYGRAVARVQ